MRAAFKSPKEAGLFMLLLLLLLASPWLAGKRFIPDREQAYLGQGSSFGPFPWIHHQIFDESSAIDIAFVGSSHLLCGIDTPYVQQKLSDELGQNKVVRTICWGGSDFDALYFITKDLLEKRKVKMLVFTDESVGQFHNNALIPAWFRYGDNFADLDGLPATEKLPYYFASIVGLPRNLVCRLRTNLPADMLASNYCQEYYQTTNPACRLGSVSSQRAFIFSIFEKRPPFSPFKPATGIQPGETCIYSAATKTNFAFLNEQLPAWQLFFAQRFCALAQQHGCKLVLMHMPVLADAQKSKIEEKQFWPETLQADIAIVGIPPQNLFRGLADSQVKELFSDIVHLNQNGQNFFTPIVTPALINLYEKCVPH